MCKRSGLELEQTKSCGLKWLTSTGVKGCKRAVVSGLGMKKKLGLKNENDSMNT